jgi:heterodisulfide reductase subunit A2
MLEKANETNGTRVGVYICHCGSNIAETVDVSQLSKYFAGQDGVEASRDYKYMCSSTGQDLIKTDIAEKGINRVVVASCSPRMHEPTFREVLGEAGLNPYFLAVANVREQCSWITKDKSIGTEAARHLIRAAIRRVALQEPLEAREVGVYPSCLVVGGGIAGIQAALSISQAGYQVYLVEKDSTIGGRMARLDKTFPTLDCSACILTPKMVAVAREKNITLLTNSRVAEVAGFTGNFRVKVVKEPRYVDESKCTGCGLCWQHCLANRYPTEKLIKKGDMVIGGSRDGSSESV